MCAEAVVACALGLPHTDYVPCVAEPDAVTGSRDAARSAERCAYDASDSAYNLAGVDSVAFRAANAAANAARVSADAASQNRSDRAAANEAAEAAEFASECVGDEALRDGVAVAIDAYRASSIVAEDRRAQYLAELRAEIRGLDAEVCEARVSIPLASPRTRT
jgi:hypothetical protein